MATIRKRTNRWQVQVRRKGLRSINHSFHTYKDAEAWARHMEVQADRSVLPPDLKALERLTLGELVLRYRETITPIKPSAATERIVLAAFHRHPICSKIVSELRTADFVAYRDERLRKVKPSTVSRQLTIIHHLFEVARKEWALPFQTNPLTDLSVQGSDQRRERRLRAGELDRLLIAAKASRNPVLVPIILFALVTAMRRGEILAMRWVHIDRSSQSLLIPETKNGHSRTIPLIPEAFQLLDLISKTDDRVFPISANCLRLSWERLRKLAGLVDLHFHDLRHEAISRFFEAGLSVPEVALISGHRDVRMLFRYTHPMRTQILSKLGQVLLIEPNPGAEATWNYLATFPKNNSDARSPFASTES